MCFLTEYKASIWIHTIVNVAARNKKLTKLNIIIKVMKI